MANQYSARKSHRLRRYCEVCREEFIVQPRLGDRQRLCGAAECRKIYLRVHRRIYRHRNVGIEREYQERQRDSRPKDHWRKYREARPEYREREKANSKLRWHRKKLASQRQLDIGQGNGITMKSGELTASQRRHVGVSDAPTIETTANEQDAVVAARLGNGGSI